MLASILSDTQGLKSSTTTGIDFEYANELSEELDIDLEKFAVEIFRVKSDLTGLSSIEIVRKDYKVFDFNGTKVFINQIESDQPEKVLEHKRDLIKALDAVQEEEGAELGFTIITDISRVNSKMIYSTEREKEVLEQAFTTVGIDNVADIGAKLSRKKDIAPAIGKVL